MNENAYLNPDQLTYGKGNTIRDAPSIVLRAECKYVYLYKGLND